MKSSGNSSIIPYTTLTKTKSKHPRNPKALNLYVNPKPLNPKPLNPKLLNPKLLNPKPLNPKLLNPKLLNPKLLNPKPESKHPRCQPVAFPQHPQSPYCQTSAAVTCHTKSKLVKGGLYRGLYRGVLQGLIRGILLLMDEILHHLRVIL